MANLTGLKKLKVPVAVVGLGKSGSSAFKLLNAMGYADEQLLTFDEKDPNAMFSSPEDLIAKNPQTLVVSPGVPLKTAWIQKLLSEGVELSSEISLACQHLTTERIIGVTGSVGKSTVVSILGAGAKDQDYDCFVGGNLGIPFSDYALSLVNGGAKAHWIVLELSSYQLENCRGLVLDFSAVTFLSPNHLERYDSLDEYYKTKLYITKITKGLCVFNSSSQDALKYSKLADCPTVFVNSKNDLSDQDRQNISLIGSHNHDNFAVAKKLAQLAGWTQASLEKMYSFKGLSHRLENVGVFSGVQFINDSKATAMDSVLVAAHGCLEGLKKQKSLHLLLGGKDKNLPWEQLSVLAQHTQMKFIFFGACGSFAKIKSGLPGKVFDKLQDGVLESLKASEAGDIVLLSPGGTSLDEFKNFEERGNFFKNQILNYYK